MLLSKNVVNYRKKIRRSKVLVHHIKKNNAGLLCVLIFILFCGLLLLTVATTKTLHSCGGSIVCFQVCNFSVYKIPIWMSLLIVASGIIFASIRVLVDLFKTQRFLKQLSILGSLPVCFSASFPTNRILVFQNDFVCWAFSAGVFRPKIYLSTGLIQLMTVKEIQAILKHEEYHCRQFDPLRNLIINFLSDSMFFFPVFRRLQRSFQVSSEKAADQFAICCGSSPLELSEALIKLFRARNQVQKFIFVSFSQCNLVDRIQTLINNDTEIKSNTNNSTDTKSKFTFSLALSFVFAVSISVGILFWQEDLSLSEKECEIRFCNLNYQLCHSKRDHH